MKTKTKKSKTKRTVKSKGKVAVKTAKPVPVSSGGRASTMSAMTEGLASLTAAGSKRTAIRFAESKPRPAQKGGKEPSLVFDKPGEQKHTREEAEAIIREIRAIVGKMYTDGKFKSSAAMMVPLTDLDNASYYKSCGCYDRAVEICNKCKSNL